MNERNAVVSKLKCPVLKKEMLDFLAISVYKVAEFFARTSSREPLQHSRILVC
jgi:hypothetical protein